MFFGQLFTCIKFLENFQEIFTFKTNLEVSGTRHAMMSYQHVKTSCMTSC